MSAQIKYVHVKTASKNLHGDHRPLCYFTLSNARRLYSSMESLWVGKG